MRLVVRIICHFSLFVFGLATRGEIACDGRQRQQRCIDRLGLKGVRLPVHRQINIKTKIARL